MLLPALMLSFTINAQSKPAYHHEKVPCSFDGKLTSRRFQLAGQPYTVRYGVFCAGPFSEADTVQAATDSLGSAQLPVVYHSQEQRVKIQLISGAKTQEIIVRKAMFNRRFAGQQEWPKIGFGSTSLERIDEQKRLLVFSTFVGYPFSDHGWLLKYSVDMNGVVSYKGLEDAVLGP
ncbi:hypothetical protein [Hymenobacter jeollabukensis]|uniref:Uncharacterized protein n=2 Tax=Hymenobacter jeollabukensis TaxID=2025313 RepID=A0A5R8WQY3_9BACT|nr:hypothetical protein FDY95_10710 [Hymenobacter jeollabukensis]